MGWSDHEKLRDSKYHSDGYGRSAGINFGLRQCQLSRIAKYPTTAMGENDRVSAYRIPQATNEANNYSPIAFHPLSVLLDSPNHMAMLEKPGIRKLVSDIMDELICIANADGCEFPNEFKVKALDTMTQPPAHNSTMYQDFIARRPIEIEVYLGSPLKIAQVVGKKAPHCETLYGVLHHMNQTNQTRTPGSSPPSTATPPPRQMSARPPPSLRNRPPPNNAPGPTGGPPGRRGPPVNGALAPNGQGRNGGYSPKPQPNGISRRNSFDNDLEEFGHIAMYGDMLETDDNGYPVEGAGAGIDGGGHPGGNVGEYGRQRIPQSGELALRERELAIRQREVELREQELMRRNIPGSRSGPPGPGGPGGSRAPSRIYEDEDDDDESHYDNVSIAPPVDPDSIDMMSVTSRRTRRVPSSGNLRNMDPGTLPPNSRGPRHSMGPPRQAALRNRTSARLVSEIPGLHDNIIENPLMGYSSNRYGAVDRKMLSDSSRANSLSAARLGDIRDDPAFSGLGRGGAYPSSHAPPLPMPRHGGPPPNNRGGYSGLSNGYPPDFRGRGGPQGHPQMRPSTGRFQPGPADNPVPGHADHRNFDPVSQSHPNKGPLGNRNRSTTGSASTSATSGESGSGVSGRLDSEYSAYSSTSSIEKKSGFSR